MYTYYLVFYVGFGSDNDWRCLRTSCNNLNFASRTICNRCHIPKGTLVEEIPKNWICEDPTCAFVNFSWRMCCKICRVPRSDGGGVVERSGWECDICRSSNFSYKINCSTCSLLRLPERYLLFCLWTIIDYLIRLFYYFSFRWADYSDVGGDIAGLPIKACKVPLAEVLK